MSVPGVRINNCCFSIFKWPAMSNVLSVFRVYRRHNCLPQTGSRLFTLKSEVPCAHLFQAQNHF